MSCETELCALLEKPAQTSTKTQDMPPVYLVFWTSTKMQDAMLVFLPKHPVLVFPAGRGLARK